MIILFLSGLTKLSDPWTKCTPRVNKNELPGKTVVYLSREHILWLHESRNEQLISSFDNVVFCIQLMQPKVYPLYFFALGYCIAVGKFMLELKVWFTNEKAIDILLIKIIFI